MIAETLWFLLGFAVPGIVYYFLVRKGSWESTKYAGLYAVALFGAGIITGLLMLLVNKESLAAKIFTILLMGSLVANFLAAYLIQRIQVFNRFRTPRWWVIPLITVLVSLMGLVTKVQGLNLFSAMWTGG